MQQQSSEDAPTTPFTVFGSNSNAEAEADVGGMLTNLGRMITFKGNISLLEEMPECQDARKEPIPEIRS